MPLPAVIPTPPAQRWRAFRVQIVPGLVFALLCGVAAVLWRQYVGPAVLVGRVEAIQTRAASPKPGWLTQLRVTRFQRVAAGDVVGEVTITPPNVLTSALAVIRAEVEQIRAGLTSANGPQHPVVEFDQLRLNCLRQRVDLATARVNLGLAASEFQRCEKLFQEKRVSDLELETARAKQQALQADVARQTQLVEEMKKSVLNLSTTTGHPQVPDNPLRAAIAVQEQKLQFTEEEIQPVIVRAPIDGTVSLVHRYPGEAVKEGDPIATIASGTAERIVGYLRQPFYLTPRPSMSVRVRTRGGRPEAGLGTIVAVGGQLEPIGDSLLPPVRYNRVEWGLPILISLPESLKTKPGEEPKVRPGELIDLILLPDG